MNGILRQLLTYWAPGALTATGQKAASAPVLVLGRWEGRTELFIDQNGAEKRSQAVVYVASDVALDGWLAEGDQTATADPKTLAGAHKIVDFQKIPDRTGARYLRRALL